MILLLQVVAQISWHEVEHICYDCVLKSRSVRGVASHTSGEVYLWVAVMIWYYTSPIIVCSAMNGGKVIHEIAKAWLRKT